MTVVYSVTDDSGSHVAWYQPSVADLIFLAVVFLALQLGQTELLNDPGTGWHIQVGRAVWQSGPPHVDSFSFTRNGTPWISQHWLCDALFSWLYDAASWNGLVIASALVLGWVYRSLFRVILASGANVAWAAVLTMLAAGCAAPHWLARPHLLSLWFLVLTFHWCCEYFRSGSRIIWLAAPLFALWCNVHGGFLAGLIVIGCSLMGQVLSGPRDDQWRRRLAGFAAVLAVAVAATLANPYGWHLHTHLGKLLFTSQVRDLIDEWRSPDFQLAESRPLEVLLLLTLVLLAIARRRVDLFSLLHIVVWIHFSLSAVRQVAFAALIVTPLLAGLTPELGIALRERFAPGGWFRWIESLGARARAWTESERAAHWPVWPVAASVLLVLAISFGFRVPALGIGTARLSPVRWPIAAVERLNEEPSTGPLFHDLNWGGYLLLATDPLRPVFADDRFELYGREFLVEYLEALQNGPAWKRLLERYEFEHVLIRPDLPLARKLRESPDWEAIHADPIAVLFQKRSSMRLALNDSD